MKEPERIDLRGSFEMPDSSSPDEQRKLGFTPYASWPGSAKSGYLWVGTDQTCFFHMSRATAVRLARFILEQAGEK